MTTFKTCHLFIISLFLPLTILAQEICDDGIDNDSNGFIDCYDSACSESESCDNFYFGKNTYCDIPATQYPSYDLRLKWASENETASSTTAITIGDLNGDDIPEIVTTNSINNTLHILDGVSGIEKFNRNVGFELANATAIAKIADDNCATIFVRSNTSEGRLSAYDCGLNLIWNVSDAGSNGYTGILSIADFNHDGIPELLHGNEIRDAETGDLLLEATDDYQTEVPYGTFAYDLLNDSECTNCSGLEIISGGTIYAINTSSSTWVKEKVKDINNILPSDEQYEIQGQNKNYNTSAIADYNEDGHIDVLFGGGQKINGDTETAVFFWDLFNSKVISYQPSSNHENGTGQISIADFDGDGLANCGFISGKIFYALENDFSLLWSKDIGNNSGYLGHSVFDFNDDKAFEIIFRTQDNLYILDGGNGNLLNQAPCYSTTVNEYPVIADINGDGASEICIACNSQDGTDLEKEDNEIQGQIRVFSADGSDTWQPSRSVWNQYFYFNVNVNDDLSIPKAQQDLSKIFSSNICTTGPNRSLNQFMAQSALINETGCPSYAAPDFELASIALVDKYACTEKSFLVSVTINNSGDLSFSGEIPITFYEGDPTTETAKKLNTDWTEFISVEKGKSTVVNVEVDAENDEFTLHAIVNDDGSTMLPFSYVKTNFRDCDNSNNGTSLDVATESFDISHEVLNMDIDCDSESKDNGEIVAFYEGSSKPNLTYYWQKASNLEDTIFQGDTFKNIPADTYVVSASRDENCYSTSETVVLESIEEGSDIIQSSNSDPKSFVKCINENLTLSVKGSHTSYQWFIKTDENNDFSEAGTESIEIIDSQSEVQVLLETKNGCTLTTKSVLISNLAPSDYQIETSTINTIQINEQLEKTIQPNLGQEIVELSINSTVNSVLWSPENALIQTSKATDHTVNIIPQSEDQKIMVEWINSNGCTEKDSLTINSFLEVLTIEQQLFDKILVYPNPTINGLLHIHGRYQSIQKLSLYNVTGELMLTEKVENNQISININSIPNGIYFLSMFGSYDKIYTRRVSIKN